MKLDEMKKAVILIIQLMLAGSVTLFSQSITSVSIDGTPDVGSVLTADYTADAGSGNYLKFEWFRYPSGILLAEDVTTYSILATDNGTEIYFKLSILKQSDDSEVMSMLSNVITVNSFPEALYLTITGEPKSNQNIYGVYVYYDTDSDPEGSSIYRWYSSDNSDGSDPVEISSGSKTYKLTDVEFGKYVGFSVTPDAQTGSTPGPITTSPVWIGPVTNDAPVASSVSLTGTTMVNDVLTGHYTYIDANGDIEGNSIYEWWRSRYDYISSDTSRITVAHGISYQQTLADTGRYIYFGVVPKAVTGVRTGTRVISVASGRVNTPPYASSVSISGPAIVGNELTGVYTYHDRDGNAQGTSIYRWIRDGSDPIPGANSVTYELTSDDEGYTITFEVTPVSETGYPDTGEPVKSSPTAEVVDNSVALPVASEVCIDGKRALDEELTGDYKYTDTSTRPRSEGVSIYQWYRNATPIPGATEINYTLTQADIDQDIFFEVTPKTSNRTPRVGLPVKSNSLARITIIKDIFYVTDEDTLLTAEPPGGYFWGEGVINSKFSPSSVDPADSPFKANYHLNTYDCGQDASKYFTVTDVKMYFESFRDVYCQNGGWDTIYVKSIPAGSLLRTFRLSDPAGIVGQINDSVIVIDPGRMRAGNKEDTLFFSTLSGTSILEIYRPFIIDSIAQVTINNIDTGDVFCNNREPFELYVSHPGGVFSGPVVDSLFDPSLTIGDATVNYIYTTKRGCVSSVSVPVHINAAPVVNFSTVDICIESETDSTRFINLTTSSDSVSVWKWEFYDLGGSSSSPFKSPAYLFKTGGVKNVTLSATTVNNCISAGTKQFDLGVKPKANFYWENECYHPSDTLRLFDATISPSVIASRSWNFFDGDSLHTMPNTIYPKRQTGYLPIEYIVRTTYPDCHDTIYREVYIRPTIHLLDTTYSEDFRNGDGGWVKDYNSENTWSFGIPDRTFINADATGDSAWFTRYDVFNQKVDSSSIISPCFDFKGYDRPMIRIKLWKRFDLNRDGAALQYKIGDQPGWEYSGTLDDGINWYNSALIKGKPGGDGVGWTARSGNIKDVGWIESRHKLDDLVGKEDVKFRIIYGSDGTAQDNDGMAFDDIWIGQRTRGVLLEHFTNYSLLSAREKDSIVTDLTSRSSEDIINIQYHTNFPGTDLYYDDNQAGSSARILFYGLSRTPYTFIDGGTNNDFARVYDYLIADLDSNDLTRRSLTNPYFNIDLNSSVNGNMLTVSGEMKALEAINAENLTLYMAVTEKKNIDTGRTGASGQTEYNNVFRKFIPDAGGISLSKTWDKDETYSLTDNTWIIENISNAADIEVIAFLQNNITKEIYQAVSNVEHNITVGIDNLVRANGNMFSLYPNPASDRITVAFDKTLEKSTDIMIYDFSGSVVRTYRTGPGIEDYTIENPGLKVGIYLIRVTTGGIDWGYRKLIISRD